MKATTHTEVYRTFEGTLKQRPAVERIIGWSGLRLAFRRKLPALILFTPTVIAALIGCVTVHLKFLMEEQAAEMGQKGAVVMSGLGTVLGDVSESIYNFLQVEQFFALLTLAWYGSHLIAEDRRLSANLLYFARPVTPIRYILGKVCTALLIGALTMLWPTLMICGTAAFSSPNWIFLRERGDLIWKVIAYSIVWVLVIASIVTAISSCFTRKGLALMCTFAIVFLVDAVARVIANVTGNADYGLMSLNQNLQAIAEWLFYKQNLLSEKLNEVRGVQSGYSWEIEASFWALSAMTLVAWAVLWRNVKRMEVIA